MGLGVNINKQVGARYSGPLDELGNVDNCALGVAPYKRLTFLYDDYLVLVVRVDDLEERYFYADYNGNIVEADVLAWLGASEGVVKKAANQLQDSNEAYQNTLADMPAITISNVFQSNGLYYDGSNSWLRINDYAAIQITEPPYSAYSNAIAYGVGEAIYSKCLNSHINAQYFLAHYEHRIELWHKNINFEINNAWTELAINKIMTTWRDKNANGFLTHTLLNEYTHTLGVTLTNRPNVTIGARSNAVDCSSVSVWLDGNIKTVLLFSSNEYLKYNDFVNQGL
ncbi:MAG: hypothetical protein ABF289_18270 [Clostridiales bacterium]